MTVLEKENRNPHFHTGLPSSNTNLELTQEFEIDKQFPDLDLSEHEDDQVKIEDQGNFFINESHKSLSEDEGIEENKGSTKQRHLFYMRNLHEDDQELSIKDDNDYLNFNIEQPSTDAKDELRMLLCNSSKTLSYNSSAEEIPRFKYKHGESRSANGQPSEWSDTNQYTSKDFGSKLGHIKGDTIIYHSIEDPGSNDLEKLLSACLVDTTQSSITTRGKDKSIESVLVKENRQLKAKICLLNKVISKFKEKDKRNSLIKDLREEVKSANQQNQ